MIAYMWLWEKTITFFIQVHSYARYSGYTAQFLARRKFFFQPLAEFWSPNVIDKGEQTLITVL